MILYKRQLNLGQPSCGLVTERLKSPQGTHGSQRTGAIGDFCIVPPGLWAGSLSLAFAYNNHFNRTLRGRYSLAESACWKLKICPTGKKVGKVMANKEGPESGRWFSQVPPSIPSRDRNSSPKQLVHCRSEGTEWHLSHWPTLSCHYIRISPSGLIWLPGVPKHMCVHVCAWALVLLRTHVSYYVSELI